MNTKDTKAALVTALHAHVDALLKTVQAYRSQVIKARAIVEHGTPGEYTLRDNIVAIHNGASLMNTDLETARKYLAMAHIESYNMVTSVRLDILQDRIDDHQEFITGYCYDADQACEDALDRYYDRLKASIQAL